MAKVIMTVDDSPSITKVVTMTLKGAGYDVLEAGDGKQALAKLKTASIHMLITDLNHYQLKLVGLCLGWKPGSYSKEQ